MNQEGQISISGDIKEIDKRGREIIIICILVGLVLIPIDYLKGLLSSTLVVCVFTILMGILFFLNQSFGFRKIRISIITLVSLVLICGTYNEGLGTGNFIYFFPMMIIIPSIVEDQGKGKTEHLALFLIACLGAIVCVLIGMAFLPFENVPKTVGLDLFYTNFIFAFIITVIFAYLNIKFERRYIEAIQGQKNHSIAARTKFLSIMGHELRTPLNGIIGAANVLKEGKTLADQKDYLEILGYCSDHMLLLVNDILDFNKIEAGKLEIRPVCLNLRQMLIKSALPFSNLFEEKNLEFKTKIDPSLDIMVWADDVRLIQIMNNLFSNSLKFTEKGFIEFEVSAKGINGNEVEVYFSVKDTGPGIDKKHQELIFESFWQVYDESHRNFTGTGLGLAICMRLLELMNSTLQLKSTLGEGSRFYFTLKLPRAQSVEITTPISLTDQSLEGFRILLVEDNEINMLIAKKSLKDYKAQVEFVYNGQEALSFLEEDSNFDLILLDLEMPVMNGYTAITPMRKYYPHIPVLAFTASLIDNEKFNYLMQLGFCDCVLKPYQPRQLLEKIYGAIEEFKKAKSLPASPGTTSSGIPSTEASKSTAPTISTTETTT